MSNDKIPVHCDILGNQLLPGMHVVSFRHQELAVFVVVKLTTKMVRIRREKPGTPAESFLRYGHDLSVVDSAQVIEYILKYR